MDHADVTEASQKRARRVRERNKGKPLGFQYSSEEEEGLTIRSAAYDSRLKNLQDALALRLVLMQHGSFRRMDVQSWHSPTCYATLRRQLVLLQSGNGAYT